MKHLLVALVGAFLLFSCQKETNISRRSGVILENFDKINNIPIIKSYVFAQDARVSRKDTDKDGIVDALDNCPTQKETVNGYLDEDGCPDVVPPPPPPPPTVDTDGDGIPDDRDKCPTEKENYNGFQDDDGCFDVPVITLPPTPIPTSYQLATPPIGDQGNEGACVPFAIAYGARSIEQYYRTGASSYSFDSNIFSPEYAYNQTVFFDCAGGTSNPAVLDLLVKQGVCTWNMMPFSDINGCNTPPTDEQRANAALYKIASYSMMLTSDRTAIKTMVAQNHPVILTIIADNSFVNAKDGFEWRVYSGSGALPHTLLIVGYDDTKGAYKVFNSWGTDWGSAGYAWISYDMAVEKGTVYTYVIY